MKEQLILLAKEKGFISDIIGKSVESIYSKKDFYYLWMCEIQKWLRDKHDIFVYVEPTTLGDNAPFIKDGMANILYNPWEHENNGISWTNEASLEFGLYQALKLIKL